MYCVIDHGICSKVHKEDKNTNAISKDKRNRIGSVKSISQSRSTRSAVAENSIALCIRSNCIHGLRKNLL